MGSERMPLGGGGEDVSTAAKLISIRFSGPSKPETSGADPEAAASDDEDESEDICWVKIDE